LSTGSIYILPTALAHCYHSTTFPKCSGELIYGQRITLLIADPIDRVVFYDIDQNWEVLTQLDEVPGVFYRVIKSLKSDVFVADLILCFIVVILDRFD